MFQVPIHTFKIIVCGSVFNRTFSQLLTTYLIRKTVGTIHIDFYQ